MAGILAEQFVMCGHSVAVFTEIAGGDTDGLPYEVHRCLGFWELCRECSRCDIVLFMGLSLRGLIPVTVARRRLVISHHGVYRGAGLRSLLESFKLWLTRFFVNISVSEFTSRRIRGRGVVIHNCYASNIFTFTLGRRRDKAFVFCGRLVPEKGAHLAIRAIAALKTRGHKVQLTIIGDGFQRAFLEALRAELCLQEDVEFVGAIGGSTLAETLSRHSCLVVPSIWDEPFGIVALEGLACCDTVVVTDRGGLPEAVGEHGIVADANPEALAEKMLLALQRGPRSGTRERLSYLASHTPRRVAKKYLRVLRVRLRRSKPVIPRKPAPPLLAA